MGVNLFNLMTFCEKKNRVRSIFFDLPENELFMRLLKCDL